MQTYKEEHRIQWHEIDAAQNLRYYAFMNLAGEAANKHADVLGFGYDDLIGENQVWVMSRVHIKFNRAPKWREKTYFETWHKGRSGLFWLRDFEMRDENGDVAVCATTSWVVMNFETRRIERKAAFESKPSVAESSYEKDAIAEPCDKIVPPAGVALELLREHKVKYSDIDFNLHANNAKYFEWVMDSIPIDVLKRFMVVDFKLNFITEARFDDTVKILCAQKFPTTEGGIGDIANDEEKVLYFQGERDGALIFQAEIQMKKR